MDKLHVLLVRYSWIVALLAPRHVMTSSLDNALLCAVCRSVIAPLDSIVKTLMEPADVFHLIYAPPQVCPLGEVYRSCGTACPPTCVKPEPGPCTENCVAGCFCPSGEYRLNGDGTGPCVRTLEQCPQNCPTDKVFFPCSGPCPYKTCDYPKGRCFGVCDPGCWCPEGKFHDLDTDTCVDKLSECKRCSDFGCGGEPHFKTFGLKWYDFHGECDLVLLSAPEFENGVGLDIHIRTTVRYDYSYISSAALEIGDSVLQVSSFGDYMLDGVSHSDLPSIMSDFYVINYTIGPDESTVEQHIFDIDLSQNQHIVIKTFKDLVSIKFENVTGADFGSSVGLLGEYATGRMLARDGMTIMEDDPNAFGQEWQVREDEPKLFQTNRDPQHPHQKCKLPDPSTSSHRRRLGETVAMDAAVNACAHWDEEERDHCVFDVMATGDIELAHQGGVF